MFESHRLALVVGGTSGLGYELALKLADTHDRVIITGRTDHNVNKPWNITFVPYNLDRVGALGPTYNNFVELIPNPIYTLAIAAGYFQPGVIHKLSEPEIQDMINVGLVAPAVLIRRILKGQELPIFVAITSTSQWTPRLQEPVYTAVKAGLAMLANSVSLDPRVHKTLVAAPAGMKTRFWKGTDKDTSDMLDPEWVAEQIISQLQDDYKYRFAKFMRGPARVEIEETR